MRYFDLHCDTMTECAVKDIPLRENTLHVSLEQVKDWEHYVQCYAVWLPDDLRGEAAWQRFLQVAERFAREVGENAGSLEQLRGPGDLEGTQQSGVAFDLKIADIARDGQLLQYVRSIAEGIVEQDPTAQNPENEILWRQLKSLRKTNVNWAAIS